MPYEQQITGLLTQWRQGDRSARDQLFAIVHPALRQNAARYLRDERRDHTLEPNALVNELYIRLVGSSQIDFQDRAHFFAIAAQIMRRILIDRARSRTVGKRGGVQERVTLTAVEGWSPVTHIGDLPAFDEVLSAFEKVDQRAAQVVELKLFGGLK